MHSLFGTSGLRFTFPGGIDLATLSGLAGAIHKTFPETTDVAIGWDTRTTSMPLAQLFSSFLLAEGLNVHQLGVVPLPALAFASSLDEHPLGVMVTASHNPPNYNGIKIFKEGWELTRAEEAAITNNMDSDSQSSSPGKLYHKNILNRYMNNIVPNPEEHTRLRFLVDAGNGTASHVTAPLIEEIGGLAICLNCEPSGYFPGRLPEPNPTNLADTLELAKELGVDLGLAHDCDADRLAVFDGNGAFLSQTRILSLFFKKKLLARKGKIMVTSVDVGMAMDDVARTYGGKVIRTRLGETHELAMRTEEVALFGEPWKIMDPEWGPWADGIRSAVQLSRWVMEEGSLGKLLEDIPDYPSIRLDFKLKNWNFERLVSELKKTFPDCSLETYDGAKCVMDGSWVLVRRSGTEEKVRLYAEALKPDVLDEIRLKTTRVLSYLSII